MRSNKQLEEEISNMQAEKGHQILRNGDISKDYKLIGKRFAGGAMGSLFPVKRKSDQKLMIGKMIMPGGDITREMVYNEIGIMMISEDEDMSII